MKKLMILSILSLLPTLSFAKVADFNALIRENKEEQIQLHGAMRDSIKETRDGLVASETTKVGNRMVFIDETASSFNPSTKKDMLVFEKEKQRAMTTGKKQFERVANEMNLSEE